MEVQYFKNRGIKWHAEIDGKWHNEADGSPGNHLCDSQCFCINAWFPFANDKQSLESILRQMGYPVAEVLLFEEGSLKKAGADQYICFEWIGKENYLNEKIKRGEKRQRGQFSTSADFAIRFRRFDGKTQIVLGEWKYTEEYKKATSKRYSDSENQTDRLNIYKGSLSADFCQINLGDLNPEALFFDPFDQLMRLQLLASWMEHENEPDSKSDETIVSVLYIAPKANRELIETITSPGLTSRGKTILDIWHSLVPDNRFAHIYTEAFLEIITRNAPNPQWGDYIKARYGGMA